MIVRIRDTRSEHMPNNGKDMMPIRMNNTEIQIDKPNKINRK